MVTANVEESADGITAALQERDIASLAALAVLGTGGLFIAQEAADQVLNMFFSGPEPSNTTELGVSALTKAVGAGLLVVLAARAGGTMAVGVGGTLAFGMLASMGLDIFDMAQRGGIPGSKPINQSLPGTRGSSSTGSVNRSSSASPTVRRASSTPQRVSAGGSGSNYR